MKSLILAALSLASASSFAIMAPKGDYIYLACNSIASRDPLNLQVIKNTENAEIKFVLRLSSGVVVEYKEARQELGPQVGGAATFRASIPHGFIHLKYNRTTSPHYPNAVLSVVESNKTTRSSMRCSQVMY